jgi:hypothetical protein
MGNSWVEIDGDKLFKGYIIPIAADSDLFRHRSAGPKACPKNSRIAVQIKLDWCPNCFGTLSELPWNRPNVKKLWSDHSDARRFNRRWSASATGGLGGFVPGVGGASRCHTWQVEDLSEN